MRISLSTLARDRQFSKAMRRIHEPVNQLFAEFQSIELKHPIFEAILIGLTDDEEDTYFKEVTNSDGFFQVICGCGTSWKSSRMTDEALKKLVLDRAIKIIKACPFANDDRDTINRIIDNWAL